MKLIIRQLALPAMTSTAGKTIETTSIDTLNIFMDSVDLNNSHVRSLCVTSRSHYPKRQQKIVNDFLWPFVCRLYLAHLIM